MTDSNKIEKLFISNVSIHSTVYGANWQDLNWYSDSYNFAFEILINHCKKNIEHSQHLFLPIVFIFRHYIEIKLKEICSSLNPEQDNLNHNIKSLWEDIDKSLLQNDGYYNNFEAEYHNLRNLISELSLIDSGSFNFRYPTDKKGNKSLEFDNIDFENFIVVSGKMTRTIESLRDYVSN